MPNANPSGLRVLVVEDNQDCADSTAILLSMYGYCPEVASDGQTALKAARAQRPDVVLLDISLPGMNGWELAKQIREQAGMTKPLLVAVTGWGRDDDRRHSAESGIDFHLTKPVEPEQLHDLLRNAQSNLGDGTRKFAQPSLVDNRLVAADLAAECAAAEATSHKKGGR